MIIPVSVSARNRAFIKAKPPCFCEPELDELVCLTLNEEFNICDSRFVLNGLRYFLRSCQFDASYLHSFFSDFITIFSDPESDSCSDDLNSYAPSRHSAGSSKLVQNNCSSSWRSFRPFRRRHRQPISVASVSEDSTAIDSTAPEVTTACSMVTRSRVAMTAAGKVAPPSSDSGPPLANGSRLVKGTVKGAACIQGLPTSSPSISVTYSPQRRRCTLNSGVTNELRVTREFQHHLNTVDSTFDNMVIQANHVLGFIGGMTVTSEGDSDKDPVTVSISALANLQSIIDELIEVGHFLLISTHDRRFTFWRPLLTFKRYCIACEDLFAKSGVCSCSP